MSFRVRTRKKRKPAGWELLEGTLDELEGKMRDVLAEETEGQATCEATWGVHRLNHQKSRFVYEMYYKKRAISRELYEWCLREKIVDSSLIAKWKKHGYEKLCCVQCVNQSASNYGTTCICRVPAKDLDSQMIVECKRCGCRGCASTD